MKRSSLAVRVVLLIVSIVASAALVQAQYRTSIQGVVTDPTGAVIPGATLTLINPATGAKQVRTSNDVGVYNFNALAAAPFTLEVEAKGFKKKVLDNVQLIPEQPNAIDIQLELGNESTTVNVDASLAPAIDTETASVSGVVSSNQIQHMPSFGRDVQRHQQLELWYD
jgi:Carboxypeptidase regulatory-like domain